MSQAKNNQAPTEKGKKNEKEAPLLNRIAATLYRVASKNPLPDEAVQEMRKEILRELGISSRHLTLWEKNDAQPSLHQFSQILAFFQKQDPTIQASDLLNPIN